MMRAQNTLEGGGGRSKDEQNCQLRAFVPHFDTFVTFFGEMATFFQQYLNLLVRV